DPVTPGPAADGRRGSCRSDAGGQGVMALPAVAWMRVERPARVFACFLGAGAARENGPQCDGKENGASHVVAQHPIAVGKDYTRLGHEAGSDRLAWIERL